LNQQLVYKHESALSAICLVFSLFIWVPLTLLTAGMVLFYGFIAYLFVHSAFISYIKGTAVKLTPTQFPDLHKRFVDCCRKLDMKEQPDAYVLHGDGLFNAFATRFLGRHFVILLSDVVDAFDDQPEALDFYIGHELGHIRRGHLTGAIWRAPAALLPLIGAAYSRAREYTCDLHGLACCPNPEHAARAIAAISAGGKRWAHVNLRELAQQSQQSGGFWMSYHELTGDYPWLVKRLARILDGDNVQFPSRSGFAWFFAFFTPRVGGRSSGAVGILAMVMVVGILAAVAIPAYHDYTKRAQASEAYLYGMQAAKLVEGYYLQNEEVPESLEQAGFTAGTLPASVDSLTYSDEDVAVTVLLKDDTQLKLIPRLDDEGNIHWSCESDMADKHLPPACRADDAQAQDE
jgi:Zn-dependent protease with chaperone function/type II secretory pathway pseudopilin PulG